MTRPGIYLSAPGLRCCAGNNRIQFFNAAVAGDQTGIQALSLPGGQRFLAGRISEELPSLGIGRSIYADTRLLRIADSALEQIRPEVEQAVYRYGPDRVGVCVGSCDNGSEGSLLAHRTYFSNAAFPGDYKLAFQEAGFPGDFISRKFGLSGPALGIAAACASSASALIQGAELIRAGFCDAVIAGGADIASETALLGFNALETLSETVCNPFSKNRQGITLGDGAAFFILSQEKGDIELIGTGESADAFHMTAPREDGAGAIRAMEAALREAGIGPEAVGYVNLHGTGTLLNDRMEAAAMTRVFSSRHPLVSSTKPVTGHTLGAAGALELALCWMALHKASKDENAAVPVHCWDGVYDEDIPPLNFARKGGRVKDLRFCMSNSFAFGGCNVSLILKKEHDHGV